jgi:hypothetical protein
VVLVEHVPQVVCEVLKPALTQQQQQQQQQQLSAVSFHP